MACACRVLEGENAKLCSDLRTAAAALTAGGPAPPQGTHRVFCGSPLAMQSNPLDKTVSDPSTGPAGSPVAGNVDDLIDQLLDRSLDRSRGSTLDGGRLVDTTLADRAPGSTLDGDRLGSSQLDGGPLDGGSLGGSFYRRREAH